MHTEREQIVSEVLAGVKELLAAWRLPQLVDAPTLARALKVDARTVYRNAGKLGGVKIGSALRFDPVVAIERARLEGEPTHASGRTRRAAQSDPLLPIR